MRISVIIPAYNAASTLNACLASLRESAMAPLETIVVDDSSTDDSADIARKHGVTVICNSARRGPAAARNRGARAARGDILVFLDADVCVHGDTLGRIAGAFEQDPSLDALHGSYDDAPASRGFFSQYKNLLHCHTHQTAHRQASTFWSGCGAVRPEIFRAHGGFDESFSRPAMEDVDLGYRMIASGRKVVLDKLVLARHLKHWTLFSMWKSDIVDRAIPWTRLMVQNRCLPDDLNVRWSQRVSAALAVALVILLACGSWFTRGVLAASSLGLLAVIVALNSPFYRFLASRRGVSFAVAAVTVHLLYLIYSPVFFLLAGAYYSVKLRDSHPLPDVEAGR